MKVRVKGITGLISLILAVSFQLDFGSAASSATEQTLKEFQERFEEFNTKAIFGENSEQLISKFGEPPYSVSYPVASPHKPDVKSNMQIMLHYPDAYFEILRVGEHIIPGIEFFQRITLTGEIWLLPHGLHVGCAKSEVRAFLGMPDESKEQMDIYTNRYEDYGYKALQFFYRNDVVRKVQFLEDVD